MSAYDFLYERGFILSSSEKFGRGGQFAALFRRGELRLRIEVDAREGEMIEFKHGDGDQYLSLLTLLRHLGLSTQYRVDSLADLREHIDAILAYYTYSFLIDRGFQLAENEHHGNGAFTFVFRRDPLRLRIRMDQEKHVDIEFNNTPFEAYTPLHYLLRHIGITPQSDDDRIEELRAHIDRILRFYDGLQEADVNTLPGS